MQKSLPAAISGCLEVQQTIGAARYLRSKEAKRVEDIIYDADTIKNQGQDPE